MRSLETRQGFRGGWGGKEPAADSIYDVDNRERRGGRAERRTEGRRDTSIYDGEVGAEKAVITGVADWSPLVLMTELVAMAVSRTMNERLAVYETQSREILTSMLVEEDDHVNQPQEHIEKWTKDHPLDKIIGDPSRPVSTRLQLQTEALFCYYDALLSSSEHKSYKDALTKSYWIDAMKSSMSLTFGDLELGKIKEQKENGVVELYFVGEAVIASKRREACIELPKITTFPKVPSEGYVLYFQRAGGIYPGTNSTSSVRKSLETRVTTYAIRITWLIVDIEDMYHGPSDTLHNPPYPLKIPQKILVSFLTEINTFLSSLSLRDTNTNYACSSHNVITSKDLKSPTHYPRGIARTSDDTKYSISNWKDGNPSRANIKQALGRIMDATRAQQKALDDELEPTLQLALDALKLTPFYNAFEISADVPEIYMQELWVTVSRHHSTLRFKLNGKIHTVNVDNFRDMLKVCPKLTGQKFEEPPLEKDILSFIRDLRHTGEINFLSYVNVNHMHQPWRSFAAIINKCLSGKTTTLESLRLSRTQILWGMYHNKKVDYVYLLWEDLMFQVENKNSKKNNDMYYPRFMAKDQAIPRRNKMFCHHAEG
ncbi:hypothetical protein Tco_1017219 [Tanacetum coccineum]|uniref:Uncharacterized protein n=1 Tax=Tanacetum coccineum TaxID=301880 RepID=A0ABQ5FRC5_9ASTR